MGIKEVFGPGTPLSTIVEKIKQLFSEVGSWTNF
jgi:methylmalonyl-CoA mutase C-terminal domain/subunit